jgi:type II secretory pathway pseudopilin PulG
MTNSNQYPENNRGYTLVEMAIYVAILAIFSATIVNTILSFSWSYRTLLALRMVDNTGIDAMERVSRDIRSATSVDTGNSTLGTSPGVLTLVATMNGVSTTTKFYLQNGIIKVDVNGTYSGPLSVSGSTITNLVFTKLVNGVSNAVKVDMTVQGVVGPITKVKTYHTTVILRGV